MIQDIAPKIFDNSYIKKTPAPDDIVLSFKGREVLCLSDEDGIRCPRVRELGIPKENLIYLFSIDGTSFYLPAGDVDSASEQAGDDTNSDGRFRYESIRILRSARPGYLCFAGMTAYHLYVWYQNSRFCGRCGTKTVIYDSERAVKCPECGNIIYPRISPAVIVGVTSGDKILFTRYAGRAYKGNALIAGFCEIGETAEDTVRREVMEEVGLKVKNIRYFKSQPWGFDSNLLLGYYCELDGDSMVTLDQNELSTAEWFQRDDIGNEHKELSLTATMMMHFKEHPEDFV